VAAHEWVYPISSCTEVITGPNVFPSVSACHCCAFRRLSFNTRQDLAFGILSERQMTSSGLRRL
jgi:hypothetical protein